MTTRFRFGEFLVDPRERRLSRGGHDVALSGRYFDALLLLVCEAGNLVSKDRFMAEVWRGVPVTDEALTQCVRTLRRVLEDDAANPRCIETVPKHGYRFVASVDRIEGAGEAAPVQARQGEDRWTRAVRLGAAGMVGGGLAGMTGGLGYGLIAASLPLAPGTGALSVLLVLVSACILVGAAGGAGVGFGLALAISAHRPLWAWVAGGTGGGLIIGGLAKLLGMDAFQLLIGQSPGAIAGAGEGVMIGAALGLGAWTARTASWRRAIATGAIAGGAGGLAIALLGGRLMAGSLAEMAARFPAARLDPARITAPLGDTGFGPLSNALTSTLEGAVFGAGVLAAMAVARRQLGDRNDSSAA
ncbi:transcriptional regulator [Sphingomonas sp. SFZ2018-12]|uniref:winged helix-turn-helix domain-containing protein n=1 Tax=Sphingomonas sp. SFZ2018-12 TaxID=2683197 RepID=UPI001F1132ED|nr:transcriptional regulator [Sphingomonas sp. SFZ2018-12]MCH4892067.1 transcriptional regulator [Sphingomonas sp. SFZ2018-12]